MPRRKKQAPPKTPLPPAPDPDALAPDEEAFVQRFLLHGKAGRAYRETHPFVTRGTAHVMGYRWLRNVKIRREIDAIRHERRKQAQPHANKFLRMMMELLTANLQDCYDEHNNILPIHQITPETAQWLQTYEIDSFTFGSGKKRVTRIKKRCRLVNKTAAIKLLAQFFGLNQEVPGIDVLISILPRELGELLRQALAGNVDLEAWVRERKKKSDELKETPAPLPPTASLPDGAPGSWPTSVSPPPNTACTD